MANQNRPEETRLGSNASQSDESVSDDEEAPLTVEEARGMLRDVLTLCERQPYRKKLAEARGKAQGDPRAAMLSVVPMVVDVAHVALAKNKQRLERMGSASASSAVAGVTAGEEGISGSSRDEPRATAESRCNRTDSDNSDQLIIRFLREAQFLVDSDTSGYMKKDMVALRSLLSPP